MKSTKCTCLLLLSVLVLVNKSTAFISIYTFLSLQDATTFAAKLYEAAVYDGEFSFKNYILERMNLISSKPDLTRLDEKLKSLSNDFHEFKETVMNAISANLIDKLTNKIDKLFEYVKDIQYEYEQFLYFYKNYEHPIEDIKKYADTVTSSSLTEMRRVIHKIHEIFVDENIKKESIVTVIAKSRASSEIMCLQELSPQQLIYRLFEIILYSHAKGLIAALYSYEFKEAYEKKSYESAKFREIQYYKDRVAKTLDQVKLAMASASCELLKCDPQRHEEDKTYAKLDAPFQGYIVSKRDLKNNLMMIPTKSCKSVRDAIPSCKTDLCKSHAAKKVCTGRLRNCQFISHGMDVCHSIDYVRSRYDWISTKENQFYGHYTECSNKQKLTSMVFHNCLCTCESVESDIARYFSLKSVLSDVEKNKVITGVRLVKQNNVFYIQIQQGKLSKNGAIVGNVKWKEIEQVPISIPLENDSEVINVINKDLYNVTYEQDTVLLDDIFIRSPTLVLTGLRFGTNDKDLMLEAHLTEFDYKTGNLEADNFSWINNGIDIKARKEVNLENSNNPDTSKKSTIFSINQQFVRFATSSVQSDLAQNTVPFVDLQEIVTNPPMPLSGAGLYHKRADGSAGFLSMKLIHFDLTFAQNK